MNSTSWICSLSYPYSPFSERRMCVLVSRLVQRKQKFSELCLNLPDRHFFDFHSFLLFLVFLLVSVRKEQTEERIKLKHPRRTGVAASLTAFVGKCTQHIRTLISLASDHPFQTLQLGPFLFNTYFLPHLHFLASYRMSPREHETNVVFHCPNWPTES